MKTIFYVLCITILISCTKDKVPVEGPKPIAERITGNYKVYDTVGNYLYSMELKYIERNSNSIYDSIIFKNIDNDFYYSEIQSSIYDIFGSSKYIYLSSPFPTKDKNNKSWTLFNSSSGGIYDNIWRNDTIRMRYRKHNTPWWPSESVPYLDTIIKQIAVKQH